MATVDATFQDESSRDSIQNLQLGFRNFRTSSRSTKFLLRPVTSIEVGGTPRVNASILSSSLVSVTFQSVAQQLSENPDGKIQRPTSPWDNLDSLSFAFFWVLMPGELSIRETQKRLCEPRIAEAFTSITHRFG